jgi:membrane protease YdiL (CAAX protease family)
MDSLKETIGILSAAIIGSFIGAAFKRNDGPLTMIISVIAGISSAYIFTPILAHYLISGSTVEAAIGNQMEYGIAFLLGLLGMTIISIVFAVADTLRQNPKEAISLIKDIIIKK